jgi:Tfp pilus assembly protein PilZ
MTPNGLVDGRTENLSLGGAFIRFPEDCNLNHTLTMVITAKGRLISLTAKLIWVDTKSQGENSKSSGIGVRFTTIMMSDRQFLQRVINNHL